MSKIKARLPISLIRLCATEDQLRALKLDRENWAAEILLVLTSKQPLTAPLSLPPQARLIRLAPVTDFALTRNLALRQARQAWVFFLDADEKLPAHVGPQLNLLLQDTEAIAWSFSRRDWFYGAPLRFGEAGRSRPIRLFHRQGATFQGRVHEVVQLTGKVKKSSLCIEHSAHQSLDHFWQKITFYARLEAESRQTGQFTTLIQLLTFPLGKFFLNYFLYRGYADGWRGLIYATLMSYHSALVRLNRLCALL